MPLSGRGSDGVPDPERLHDLLVEDETEFCDLLECVIGITEPAAEVYRNVLAHPNSTVKELSQSMDCDPSTINRRLDRLREKELVTRRRSVLSGGGVVYHYEPASLDRVEGRMHQTIDEWAGSMHEEVETVRDTLEPP